MTRTTVVKIPYLSIFSISGKQGFFFGLYFKNIVSRLNNETYMSIYMFISKNNHY
ncbi:hypothetical protein QE382_003410 [Sphingobacterium zeae]|uniref:Uncharacterized protein n=1 Tax=Sphingobacterium zeae TaxID=1776859 RepID=A0ABU0U991_9SPHI|nr:hypothetical protein [Sphingobacterium zeae]